MDWEKSISRFVNLGAIVAVIAGGVLIGMEVRSCNVQREAEKTKQLQTEVDKENSSIEQKKINLAVSKEANKNRKPFTIACFQHRNLFFAAHVYGDVNLIDQSGLICVGKACGHCRVIPGHAKVNMKKAKAVEAKPIDPAECAEKNCEKL